MNTQVLTTAEDRVVRLVSLGCTTRQAAAILGVSHSTADNHRWRAMQKLGVHSLAALMRAAMSLGITSLDDRLTEAELTKAAECGRLRSMPAGATEDVRAGPECTSSNPSPG